MNHKRIITVDETADKVIVVGIEDDGSAYVSSADILDLPKYTEPDIEQIRKEAYEKGWKEAEDHYEKGYNDGYDTGLSDAWECARKIIHMPEGDLLNIFTECYSAVCTALQVLLKYDASEAIEKIRQYEQEKEEEIQVGDEIEAMAGNAVVIEVIDDGQIVRYMYPDTITGRNKACNVTRTGRHFPEIAEVLRKMKKEDNG